MNSEQFVNALRHDLNHPEYNPGFRQLIHVAYKVAYELGDEFFQALEEHAALIASNVTENLYAQHIIPLFG